jgi:hypothetical protein
MVGFGNAKRMDLVQGILKDDKKKNKKTKDRSSLSGASSRSSVRSGHSSSGSTVGSVANRSVGSSRSTSTYSTFGDEDPFNYKRVMRLQKSWEFVKMNVDSVDLGEQILLFMIQTDEACRDAMNLPSLRSERCTKLSQLLIETIDVYIFLLGPDFDEEDLAESADNLKSEGIPVAILAEALPEAVNECVGGLSELDKRVWTETMGALLLKSAASAP